jgi:hypothetical protein
MATVNRMPTSRAQTVDRISACRTTFDTVTGIARAFPDVELVTKYDGSPVLKVNGSFVAGLATHESAEADTLIVRMDINHRGWLLEDAPGTYYVTDYYEKYPVVLARLSSLTDDAVRDLHAGSRVLAREKAPRARRHSGTSPR